jgi:lysophospholipase L1-like esterase
MLPRFFKPERVVVSNHAESGESLASFLGERRMDKLLTTLRAGDVLLIQFGHNDMKQTGDDAGPYKNYTRLLKQYVATARERGAIPVLVTPMHRITFDDSGKVTESLGDYPAAMRRVAKNEGVLLIDLNAMSREYYEAVGPEPIKAAFVDDTHSNETAAYEFSRFIAAEIGRSDFPIAGEVVDDLPPAKFH